MTINILTERTYTSTAKRSSSRRRNGPTDSPASWWGARSIGCVELLAQHQAFGPASPGYRARHAWLWSSAKGGTAGSVRLPRRSIRDMLDEIDIDRPILWATPMADHARCGWHWTPRIGSTGWC